LRFLSYDRGQERLGQNFQAMAEILKPDICVIGGGSGGLSVAAAAAAFGVPVVLIERHKMGGDCLNTGCVPSKALLAAAKRAAAMRSAAPFGVTASSIDVDFGSVHDHVQRVIAAIAPADSAERFAGLGVRVIKGQAKFKNRRTVVVGKDVEIRARRFVIATGSAPALPPIPGLDEGPYLTNESVFDLTELPGRLIIIGAGPIGLEMAQAFRRLGSEVTVLEAAMPLAKDDPECAAIVLDQLEREGVVVRSGVKVARVKHASGSVAVTFEGADGAETVEGGRLLVATGRKPTTDGLDLEAARIKYDRLGIRVNKKLKTANRRVYAIGDVAAGQLQFTHAANYHAGLVIRNALFRLPVKVNNGVVPWVTYTEPELAQAGLTEAQARKRGIKIRILRRPYHDNDRAQAERETHGHIKVIANSKGKIVGATIVGAQAGELIAMWTLAIAQGLNVRSLTGIVLPYPTLSEVGKRAAIDYFTPSLTSPWVRRIIAWLRIFG
jgi:pyruvate/2-oxoglutarate dehydrogenase complex dihydrolipoamide dehydrogenase (E3) component